jgi:excisionase family DNA binding protein
MLKSELQEYPPVLTVREVMQILAIGKDLIYRLIKNGEIKAGKVGQKKYRIQRADLIHYLDNLDH